MDIGISDIERAAKTLAHHVARTPCAESRTLRSILGAELWLKFENLQFTASFKERGARVKLASLSAEERARGVLAVSAGNHAQAVAYHARALAIRATIVMPISTPNVKVEGTRALGAEVVLEGDDLEAAADHAEQLAVARGLLPVHPYDDPLVIAGQGTAVLEMLAEAPPLDVLLVPVGGGGLAAGSAIVAKSRTPAPEVIGVQVVGYDTLRRALAELAPAHARASDAAEETSRVMGGPPSGPGAAQLGAAASRPRSALRASTIAEGIAVKRLGRRTLPILARYLDDVITVSESAIEESVRLLLEIEKTVVEGAGAAGVAAILSRPERFAGRRVGTLLTGGNIDQMVLSAIMHRGLVRSGRLARLEVELRDVPGAFAELATTLGAAGANIVEVHHQRAFTNLPLRAAEVQLVLQTRGVTHMQAILESLETAGFAAHWLSRDDRNGAMSGFGRPTGATAGDAGASVTTGDARAAPDDAGAGATTGDASAGGAARSSGE
jgi:threonine dehydratase